MVLQILVREPKYQRGSGSLSPARRQSQQQQQQKQQHSPQAGAGATAGAAGRGVYGNASVNNRRTSVPLTNPIGGGLPIAVIGAPTASAPASLEAPERYTQIVAVWQSDCLVCGLSPFDSDTLILLGYPVEEDEEDEEEPGKGEGEGQENGDAGGGEGGERVRVWGGARGLFQPEVQLVKRHNGEVRKKRELLYHSSFLVWSCDTGWLEACMLFFFFLLFFWGRLGAFARSRTGQKRSLRSSRDGFAAQMDHSPCLCTAGF